MIVLPDRGPACLSHLSRGLYFQPLAHPPSTILAPSHPHTTLLSMLPKRPLLSHLSTFGPAVSSVWNAVSLSSFESLLKCHLCRAPLMPQLKKAVLARQAPCCPPFQVSHSTCHLLCSQSVHPTGVRAPLRTVLFMVEFASVPRSGGLRGIGPINEQK